MEHDAIIRQLVSRTIPEGERDEFYVQLDGDVDRDRKGTLRTSSGNRVEYDVNGERTEFDEDGYAVASSTEGVLGSEAGTVTDTPTDPEPEADRDVIDLHGTRSVEDLRAAGAGAEKEHPLDLDALRAASEERQTADVADGFEEADPYDTWSKPDLQAECEARCIEHSTRDTITDLVEALEANDAEEEGGV
jgi:hypothetical protein